MAKKSTKGIGLVNECAPARPSRADADREKRWQAESDLRTLQDAEKIRADRGRVSMAQRVAKEQVAALSKITKGKR